MGATLNNLLLPVRTFPPGTLIVEPVDDAAHQLLASYLPDELKEEKVVIEHNAEFEPTFWRVNEKILIFLKKYPHSIKYRVYEACPTGTLVRRHS
jgi:hypothetical protein